jgi:hypothetical protein
VPGKWPAIGHQHCRDLAFGPRVEAALCETGVHFKERRAVDVEAVFEPTVKQFAKRNAGMSRSVVLEVTARL